MRLGVNLLWCVPGQVGGSEEYLVRQLLGLAAADPGWRDGVVLFAPPGFADAHPDLAERFEVVIAPVGGRRRPLRVVTEATWLRRRMDGFEVVHHGGGTVPPRSPGPIVLTVHDLQYLEYPGYFSPIKLRYLRTVVPRSIRRSVAVAVPSEFVRRTVIDAVDGLDPGCVVVVPHGVEPGLGDHATGADELRRRLRIGDRRVVVYPAITHPHKNHRFLIRLMDGPWGDDDLALVLIGGAGAAEADVLAAIARSAGCIVRTGRVSSADRDGLIAMADALAFPSEYEGFGAPVLEAMALGTPVITSDRAALAEVVGDAGQVLPLELDAWAGALDVVERDRQRWVDGGLRRAGELSALASGRALGRVYRSVLR